MGINERNPIKSAPRGDRHITWLQHTHASLLQVISIWYRDLDCRIFASFNFFHWRNLKIEDIFLQNKRLLLRILEFLADTLRFDEIHEVASTSSFFPFNPRLQLFVSYLFIIHLAESLKQLYFMSSITTSRVCEISLDFRCTPLFSIKHSITLSLPIAFISGLIHSILYYVWSPKSTMTSHSLRRGANQLLKSWNSNAGFRRKFERDKTRFHRSSLFTPLLEICHGLRKGVQIPEPMNESIEKWSWSWSIIEKNSLPSYDIYWNSKIVFFMKLYTM